MPSGSCLGCFFYMMFLYGLLPLLLLPLRRAFACIEECLTVHCLDQRLSNKIMDDLEKLQDHQIIAKLQEYNLPVIPVTPSSRKLLINRLRNAQLSSVTTKIPEAAASSPAQKAKKRSEEPSVSKASESEGEESFGRTLTDAEIAKIFSEYGWRKPKITDKNRLCLQKKMYHQRARSGSLSKPRVSSVSSTLREHAGDYDNEQDDTMEVEDLEKSEEFEILMAVSDNQTPAVQSPDIVLSLVVNPPYPGEHEQLSTSAKSQSSFVSHIPAGPMGTPFESSTTKQVAASDLSPTSSVLGHDLSLSSISAPVAPSVFDRQKFATSAEPSYEWGGAKQKNISDENRAFEEDLQARIFRAKTSTPRVSQESILFSGQTSTPYNPPAKPATPTVVRSISSLQTPQRNVVTEEKVSYPEEAKPVETEVSWSEDEEDAEIPRPVRAVTPPVNVPTYIPHFCFAIVAIVIVYWHLQNYKSDESVRIVLNILWYVIGFGVVIVEIMCLNSLSRAEEDVLDEPYEVSRFPFTLDDTLNKTPLMTMMKIRADLTDEDPANDWRIGVVEDMLKFHKAKIIHMSLDSTSEGREINVECRTEQDAKDVYKAVHGRGYGGKILVVKYVTPQRYFEYFPMQVSSDDVVLPTSDPSFVTVRGGGYPKGRRGRKVRD